jgi:hypothetical protein
MTQFIVLAVLLLPSILWMVAGLDYFDNSSAIAENDDDEVVTYADLIADHHQALLDAYNNQRSS